MDKKKNFLSEKDVSIYTANGDLSKQWFVAYKDLELLNKVEEKKRLKILF